MASIYPTSRIYLLHGVPLDNTYDHTIYFSTIGEQATYFMSHQKYDLQNYTYQRVRRGYIRVNIGVENLFDVNYLMFNNVNFGNKWFYAFVTSVEYINNDCTEINYELDVLQTWHFDYKLDHCFIERQHTTTDAIGGNILPEPVECGEYVTNPTVGNDHSAYTSIFADLSNLLVILGVVSLEEDEEVTTDNVNGKFYDGVYGGLTLYWFKTTAAGRAALNEKLSDYVQAPESIAALYVIPIYLLGEALASEDASGEVSSGNRGTEMTALFGSINANTQLDGYTPENKKLLTYPYNFYHVDNGNGSSLALRYEFFNNLTVGLQLNGTITQPCQITVRPNNYKKATGTLNTEILTLDGYPLCSWNMDAYAAYTAQTGIPKAIGYGLGIGTAIFGALTGNAVMAGAGVTSLVHQVAGNLTERYQSSIKADISGGNFGGSNVNVSAGKQQFFAGRFSITADYAKVIDDFFSRFGYAIRALAVPIRNARPRWTYVKTMGCTVSVYTGGQTISGGVPADDLKKIISIYDSGITWWRYRQDMDLGNYSLDNKPV